jgi:hypothetical protein
MNRFTITVVLTCLLTIPLLVTGARTAESPGEPTKDDAAEIKVLQKERIAALSRAADVLLEHYRAGVADLRALAFAEKELVDAKLDSTDMPAERITLLNEELTRSEHFLAVAEARVRAGAASEVEGLQAKALVLDVKIKLLRERGKAKTAAK